MSPEPRWLDPQEERVWRGWLRAHATLADRLQRQLHEDTGLSMPDFEVLVHLTDDAEGRLRVCDLAEHLHWERSRVSHHVTRMERRGLVERAQCAEDGRGAFVVVTDAGRAAIERAAPGHVQEVRTAFLDALDPEQLRALDSVLGAVLALADRSGRMDSAASADSVDSADSAG